MSTTQAWLRRDDVLHAIDHFEPAFIQELTSERETWIADNMRYMILQRVRGLQSPTVASTSQSEADLKLLRELSEALEPIAKNADFYREDVPHFEFVCIPLQYLRIGRAAYEKLRSHLAQGATP
jgi:hypothetical protein